MKRNVSGQFIGAQLVSKTNGDPVTTGSTIVYLTGDNRVQGLGTVNSGICTHKGNGYWIYEPDQIETDNALIVFTFVNALALNATIQVFTTYPQSGDAYASIGTAGAGLTSLGDSRIANLNATISSRLASNSYVAPDNTTIATIAGYTDSIESRLPVALINGKMDSSVSGIPTASENAAAVRTNLNTELNRIDSTISSRLSSSSYVVPPTASENAAAVWSDEMALKMLKLNKNKYILNPDDGTIKIYDDDETTILYSGLAYSDAAGTILYNGKSAIHHTTRLV